MIQIRGAKALREKKFTECSHLVLAEAGVGGTGPDSARANLKEDWDMKINILGAEMRRTEDGYVGSVRFAVEGHRHPYEAALHSKDGKDWAYGLFFMSESGSMRDIDRVEEYLEENDEAFDLLVRSAWRTLEQQNGGT
jgi:predicted RNase H-like HicB family nuclease